MVVRLGDARIMPVQLDAQGHPLAWGDRIEGEDIPDPPQELVTDGQRRAMWTGSEWVADPDFTPPDTPTKVKNDLQAGNITEREALVRTLDMLRESV